jgi:glutathione S-transferase
MKLYGSTLSPFVRKVAAFAAEKGLALEPVRVAPGDENREFREVSPFGKIPGFRDGDFGISDSSAIVHYLEAKYPEPALIPAEPQARARVIWFEEFADTILAAAGAKVFFNRIVAPRFLDRSGDEVAAAAAVRDELPKLFDYLEKVVPAPGGFLVGQAITLADIAVASPFVNLGHCGVDVDCDRHPRVAAYVDSILARPSFAPIVESERRFLAA